MSGYNYFEQYDGDESPPPYSGVSDEEMMDAPEYYYRYSDDDENDYYRCHDDDENDSQPSKPKPKKTPAAGKLVIKKCRTCGNAGHDSRNCAINKGFTGKNKKPKATALPPPPPPPIQQKAPKPSKPAEEKACGACREIGHDRRSCPKLLGAPEQRKQEEVVAVVKKFMETMAGAVAPPVPSPVKAKSKTKKEAPPVETKVPKKQTTKGSRGKAVEAEQEKATKPHQSQTAKRSKKVKPLGASGSRGGAGIAKKYGEPAAKKKKAPAATSANVANGGINFTINWG
ncbi:uncharacterized protein DFL_006009 [Arthrobotrys flagrans]|uniref:CCHC-type domain-containing protein n=1 Tax=Arthrobotrys flagrans TaxID=97331 RepID=A0A436ZZ12_ARTFL|nr:hypothetical protein DFL_006009 [Arthrobotrys flagrans]